MVLLHLGSEGATACYIMGTLTGGLNLVRLVTGVSYIRAPHRGTLRSDTELTPGLLCWEEHSSDEIALERQVRLPPGFCAFG